VSDEALVSVDVRERCCVIQLQRRKKLNALSTALEEQLISAIRSPEATASPALVFTGGDDVFSAGADINEMRRNDPASIFAQYQASGRVYEEIASLPQATFSAISGYCLGGGFELALATDFRVADRSAVFGLPEVGIGIIPSSGGTYRLSRLIGPARAKELIILRSRIDADQAQALGLVTELVETDALAHALELAERVADLPPLAVTVAKRAIEAIPDSSRDVSILVEQLAYGMLAQTKDADEAAEGFIERQT
jgi:enoyl-CoA hydratase/carnithine racemase